MMRESKVTSMLPPQTRTPVVTLRWFASEVLPCSSAAKAAGAGAFGEGLFAFEQDEDGGGDLVFVDGDDLVDIFFYDREGKPAGGADGDAVGDGGGGVDGDGVMGFDGGLHGGQARGLHADDADVWVRLLDGAGDAADEAAAADGDDDGFERGNLLHHLERDGSLTGHDGCVVEGVEEDHAFALAEARGFFVGLVVVGSV